MTRIVSTSPGGTIPPRGLGAPDQIHWQLVPARELFDLVYGKALVASSRKAGHIPVYGTNGQCGWHDTPLFSGPGVVLGRKGQGPLGVEWVNGDYWVIDTGYSLRPKSDIIDLRYSYFLIDYIGLNHLKDGTSNPTLSREVFGSQALPVPPLPDQRAIAATLGVLDDKIELNRRMNETLEGMAQAIFRDWFAVFGPVRRKAAGEADPVAIMGGLTSDPARAAELAALFPAAFGDDELPAGWTLAPLSDLLVLQRGFDLPKTTRTEGAFPVIAASGPSGTHNEFKVKGPGVCTGRSGVLGGVYYVEEDFWPLNTSLWIKDYPGSSPLHAFHLLRGIDLAGFNAGSAVPTLNRNHIHGLPTVKPPIAVVRAFDALVGPLYAKMAASDGENIVLAETRDYLLPRLMSGAVRVAPLLDEAGH